MTTAIAAAASHAAALDPHGPAHARNVQRGPAHVEAAVREASARTGVDFAYLMEKAAVESGFRTDIKASTSSATGLYQFIESTWLNTVKEHGAKHGLGRYAAAIETRGDGRAVVSDPGMRRAILDLRKDARVSALMAGEFAADNKRHLEQNVGGPVGSTELYMAHFLGAHGASKFLNAMKDSPNRPARELFPDAAAANRNVFFDRKTGEARSLKEIYDRFAGKFSGDGPTVPPETAVNERVRRNDMPDGFTVQTPLWPRQALQASPLSIYQVLALNALKTPDEAGKDEPSSRRDERRVRDEPVRTEQTPDVQLGLGLGLANVSA